MFRIVEYSIAYLYLILSATQSKHFFAFRQGFVSSPTIFCESARISGVNTTCGPSPVNPFTAGSLGSQGRTSPGLISNETACVVYSYSILNGVGAFFLVGCSRYTDRIGLSLLSVLLTEGEAAVSSKSSWKGEERGIGSQARMICPAGAALAFAVTRSEERRVGKEGRSRWYARH